MPGGFEVSTRDDLKRIADVDHQSSWLVRNVVPLLVSAPDLKA